MLRCGAVRCGAVRCGAEHEATPMITHRRLPLREAHAMIVAVRNKNASGELNMNSARFATLLLGALLLPAGAFAAPASDEQNIRELDKNWSAAAGGKDAAKTASFYAEDGALMPFNGPIVHGKANIEATWAGLMANPGFAIHFEPTSIVVAKSRDIAYDIGTFELTMSDDKGKSSVMVGKFLVAWQKQKNGEWKVAADCFNTDK
jgi:uncharacterized protein (TIGR02246 family)